MGPFYLAPDPREVWQGDIYNTVPSVVAISASMAVLRERGQGSGGRREVFIHDQSNPPRDGFKWRVEDGGDQMVLRGFVERGMVLSHDCEIENDDSLRLVAMVRPLEHIDEAHRDDVRSGGAAAAFFLPAQTEPPAMTDSFVDFRRLVPVRPDVLVAEDKYCGLAEDLRQAMREHFWRYLHRPYQSPRPRREPR